MSKHENDKDDKTTSQGGVSPSDSADKGDDAATRAAAASIDAPRRGDDLALSITGDHPPTSEQSTLAGDTKGAGTAGDDTPAGGEREKTTKGASGFAATGANTPPRSGSSGAGGGSGATPPGGGERKRGRSGVLLVVLVVLLLVLLAALAWGATRLSQQRHDIDALAQRLQDTEALRGQVQNGQQVTRSLGERLDQVDQHMESIRKELAATQQTDAREWLYAEVEYLLRLANQRLQLERDVGGAQALLHAADRRLEQADNPAFLPVRREIHSELAALDSVPNVDRSGIYLQLAAEAQQLEKLPLSQDTEALSAKVDDGSTYSGGWREQLARMGSQLKDLVTVRHHDEVLEALITPEQEGYLRQNVRLLLEQAQLALLKGEPEVYRTSLGRAGELVKAYYKTDSDGVQKALGRLDQLAGRDIHPELPDISASLTQLRDVIASRTGVGAAQGQPRAEGGQDQGVSGQPQAEGSQGERAGAQRQGDDQGASAQPQTGGEAQGDGGQAQRGEGAANGGDGQGGAPQDGDADQEAHTL